MNSAHLFIQNSDWRRYRSWQQLLHTIARIRYEIIYKPLVLDHDPSEMLYNDDLYHFRKTEEMRAITK